MSLSSVLDIAWMHAKDFWWSALNCEVRAFHAALKPNRGGCAAELLAHVPSLLLPGATPYHCQLLMRNESTLRMHSGSVEST